MLRVLSGFLLLIVLPLYITNCEQNENSAFQAGFTAESSLADPAHNSRNSLDWAGTYTGITPCADCEGIKTTLSISYDQSYKLSTEYLGKSDSIFQTGGTFHWAGEGDKIRLTFENRSRPSEYLVRENKLIQLDSYGNRISGELAGKYILDKKSEDITDRHWKLAGVNSNEISLATPKTEDPYLELHSIDSRVTGHSGCNSFSGSFHLSGSNQLSFSNMASTNAECTSLNYESSYFTNLASASSYVLRSDTLYIYSGRDNEFLQFIESSAGN